MPVVVDVGRKVDGCNRRCGRTSRSAMKKNLNLVEMSRAKKHGKVVTPNLPQLQDKETQTPILCQNEGRESMVLGPSEARETGVFGPNNGILCCPSEGMGSVGLAPNEERKSGVLGLNAERENGILGTNEGIEDELLGLYEWIESPSEESESGGVGANKERGSEVMGASAERRESEWHSLVSWLDDDVGFLQEEWEWIELEDKVREDAVKRWPWMWSSNNGDGDGDYLSMDGIEQEQFGSWLMSGDIDCLVKEDVTKMLL